MGEPSNSWGEVQLLEQLTRSRVGKGTSLPHGWQVFQQLGPHVTEENWPRVSGE